MRGAENRMAPCPLGQDAKVELLKKVPLFADCSKTELRALAATADEIDVREGTS